MYLLDTNIVSELRKGGRADSNLLNWATSVSATALVHGLIVVTRNIKDFKETGVELLNLWE